MDEMGRAFSMNRDIGGERQKKKRPLGRPRHRWVDNIKMDLKTG
jgi:hypothetical protein